MAVGSDLLLHFVFGSCRQYRKHDNASKSELDNFFILTFFTFKFNQRLFFCFLFFCRCKIICNKGIVVQFFGLQVRLNI